MSQKLLQKHKIYGRIKSFVVTDDFLFTNTICKFLFLEAFFMITFGLCVLILLAGYFFYGRRIDRIFGPDDRKTPAEIMNDGVDYIPMPTWKIFLIQLLNIAGTGPIFGALSGAVFGPVAYLWIVFGCIFAGGIHDYMCGMMSIRHKGANIPELSGIYLGNKMKIVMNIFSVILLVMCGVVFTTGPADLIAMLTPEKLTSYFWLYAILIYYFIATFVPIDKVIGKIYPIFGICLIIMAFGVSGSMIFSDNISMPEIWQNFSNNHPSGLQVWPFMFVTIACGAVSGFHATQSPMMSRCVKSEKDGHKIFYGAMIAEGLIALVWAAAGVSCYESSTALMEAGGGCSAVVYNICTSTMGKIGGVLALIGVIVCPISSGDTAYRSARITLADWLSIEQSNLKKRFLLTAVLLVAGGIICHIDYSVVWRFFSWANQTLAMITLWTASVYLRKNKKKYIITLVPAAFMTAVSITYFFVAPECLGGLWTGLKIANEIYYPIAVVAGIIVAGLFLCIFRKNSVHCDDKFVE